MDKKDLKTFRIPVCKLVGPADCQYRVNGELSHIMLCGGNRFNEYVEKCLFRQILIAEETEKIEIVL